MGCFQRSQADDLITELREMGGLKYHETTEESWETLLTSSP